MDAEVKEPPVPDTILQAPVPIVGLFPARVTCVSPHVTEPVWSVPAEAEGDAFIVCIPPADVGPPDLLFVDVKFEVVKALTPNVALLVGDDATSIVIQK